MNQPASLNNTLTVYTTLRLLEGMKERLGLEAMLEYQTKYLQIIETHNPELKNAVTKAFAWMDIKKAYTDIVS